MRYLIAALIVGAGAIVAGCASVGEDGAPASVAADPSQAPPEGETEEPLPPPPPPPPPPAVIMPGAPIISEPQTGGGERVGEGSATPD